jgi:hypothetical protein
MSTAHHLFAVPFQSSHFVPRAFISLSFFARHLDQLRRRERYHQNTSLKGVSLGSDAILMTGHLAESVLVESIQAPKTIQRMIVIPEQGGWRCMLEGIGFVAAGSIAAHRPSAKRI